MTGIEARFSVVPARDSELYHSLQRHTTAGLICPSVSEIIQDQIVGWMRSLTPEQIASVDVGEGVGYDIALDRELTSETGYHYVVRLVPIRRVYR